VILSIYLITAGALISAQKMIRLTLPDFNIVNEAGLSTHQAE